jgi:hypothetical protein
MELQPPTTEQDTTTEETIDYEAIRQELLTHQQREINKELSSGHLLDVNLELVSERDLLFWKYSREVANRVKELYKIPNDFSELDFWELYDKVKSLEKEWESQYYQRQQLTTSEGRFVAFIANSFVVAEGYMSLIEKHRNHQAVEHLAQFKQAQSDPEAKYRTAYLAETQVEELLESDLHAYQLLQAVEMCEKELDNLHILDRARAYTQERDAAIIAALDPEHQKLIEEYMSLSLRLFHMWESWHDVEKLDNSRYDFYNYLGNRVNVIAGNQELA